VSATDIAYTVRRSPRARRVRVAVDPERGVEVVLPRRAPDRAAAEAVAELRTWIVRRLDEAERVRELVAARGDTVPYLGADLRLVPEAGRTRVHRRGDALLVPAGDHRPALERWFRRVARSEVEPRLEEATAALGVPYRALTIRNQRTRWGSCSSTGAVSVNWRLLLAPPDVLEYVVWHEACHLVVLDHSPAFWSLLRRHVPDFDEPRRWLRRHGQTLVL
jgi:hypothetical protein